MTSSNMDNLLAAKTNLSTYYDPGKELGANATWSSLITPFIENFIIGIGLISFATMLYSGFQYISADGDEGKIKQASSILTYAIIGLVLAGASFLLLSIITSVTRFKFLGI